VRLSTSYNVSFSGDTRILINTKGATALMQNRHVFLIKDRVFEVNAATFRIRVDEADAITWLIDITTLAVSDDRGTWQPHLSAELTNPPIEQPYSWHQFHLTIPNAYVEETGEYPASLYVFGHHDVYNSDITITRDYGNLYTISWRGVGDVHFDENDDTGLPLTITSPIRFEGIQTPDHDEEQARKRIACMIADEPVIMIKTKEGMKFLLAPQPTTRRT
jgi:hypothetical protein